MTTGDTLYVCGAFLAGMGICSLSMLGNMRGAGPRYRAALIRGLAAGWGVAALVGAWVVVGGLAVEAGGRAFGTYRDFTLVLMGAMFVLLPVALRAGNRALASARQADRGLPA